MPQQYTKTHYFIFVSIIAAVLLVGITGISVFGAPQSEGEPERFIVPLNFGSGATIEILHAEGFIKSQTGFRLALQFKGKNPGDIEPGGYKIAKSMSAWSIADVLAGDPYMKWVVIPEGWRKEQIAERLAAALDWTDAETQDWVMNHTAQTPEETEGVYFPDTYLISQDEDPQAVAERFRTRFDEVFTPYLKEANAQNIIWTTLLKAASLVQREAAGKEDMPIIAGVIWNRLLNDQKLDIDATVQYARDSQQAYANGIYTGIDAWWAPISGDDTRSIDSPYNTYAHKGLPPRPIANPGTDAIEAVLHPADTSCFYYLHDNSGTIHCAETFEKHKENIETYLR